jgi:molybdopterin converting factor small subunit
MSRVTVRIPAPLRPYAGGQQVFELEADTVGAALTRIGAEHVNFLSRIQTPEGQLRPFVNVFVGETSVRTLDGLATPLDEGAVISILPAVAGGSGR